MNATDRAERALYVSQDCGGRGAMRARGNVVARLAIGKQPRMRDVRALESAARMAGNDLSNWRNASPVVAGNRFAELGHRLINSWWVLAPLGLMCAWAILDSAGVFKP